MHMKSFNEIKENIDKFEAVIGYKFNNRRIYIRSSNT